MATNQNTKAITIIEAVKNDPMVIETQLRLNEVKAIHQAVFQKGVHYGPPYAGAKNDTLLKPGATFLQQKYGLREHHERLETTIVVNPDDLSKSYIIIQDRCRIFDANGQEVAQCDAACSTFEDKYLFRTGNLKCPDCGKETIRKSKDDQRPGYYCWQKLDAQACGHKFAANDTRITDQQVGKVPNENPLNLLDTIVAMAQKRAAVRATIKATGVDALFSPGDGVVVDYYDGLDQPEQELITVVSKNALPTHQEGATGAQGNLSTPTSHTPPDDAQTAKSRFAGNGAPPNGEQKRIGDSDETREWTATAVTVRKDKFGKPYLQYTCDQGKPTGRGREMLRSAGYECEDWTQENETYQLTPPAKVTVQKKGIFWNVTALAVDLSKVDF